MQRNAPLASGRHTPVGQSTSVQQTSVHVFGVAVRRQFDDAQSSLLVHVAPNAFPPLPSTPVQLSERSAELAGPFSTHDKLTPSMLPQLLFADVQQG
jgi:hypothetical protein